MIDPYEGEWIGRELGRDFDGELEAAILHHVLYPLIHSSGRTLEDVTRNVRAGSVQAHLADALKHGASWAVRITWQETRADDVIVLAGAWTTLEDLTAVVDRHIERTRRHDTGR